MFKILLFIIFLSISLIYSYSLTCIILLVILFIYYFNPEYHKSLRIVDIAKVFRVFIAILYIEKSLSILIFNVDVLLQTKPLVIVILLVFSHLVSILVGTAVCLYKDCDWVFNRIAGKINPIVIQLFLIFFWFKFIIFYIKLVVILLIYGSNDQCNYILAIMSVPFIHYNYSVIYFICIYWWELYKLFNRIEDKINPTILNRFKVFIWWVCAIIHTIYTILVISFWDATQLDCILVFVGLFFLFDNYNSNNKK